MSHLLLFGGAASFRHGKAPLDVGTSTGASASSTTQRAAQALVTVSLPARAEKNHALATASTPAPPIAPDTRRAYPSMPFYGLLNALEIILEAPAEEETRAWSRDVDACLQSVVRHAGLVYYLGTQSALQDPDVRGGQASSSATTLNASVSGATPATPTTNTTTASASASPVNLCLPYSAYVSALMDGLAQFTQRREQASAACASSSTVLTPHTLHVRLGGHPRWKDLCVMLAVERGRLVLYVSASSRLTQQFLSDRAAELSLDLSWVAGATMVEEPRTLRPTDVNPVFALWDCFMALPLLASSPVEGGEAGQGVPDSDACLLGFYVSILSSLPLPGAERHGLALRLARTVTAPRTDPAHDSARRPRHVWRLVAGSGARGVAVVLPCFFTHLVQALVGLARTARLPAGFTLACAADARASKSRLTGASYWWRGAGTRHATAAAGSRAAAPALSGRPQGLTYVTAHSGGAAQVFAPLRSSSSQGWLGVTRLSSAAWVCDEARLVAGLEEDDEECEFNLLGLHYHPPRMTAQTDTVAAAAPKRARGAAATRDDGVRTDAEVMVDTAHWPPSFTWQVEVTRVMAYSSSDSGEDGGL